MTLLDEAEFIMNRLPGCRVEVIGGVITVTMLPDLAHASTLTHLTRTFFAAGLHEGETEVLQRVGLWLPGGPEDYAVPDLSIIDADSDDRVIEYNCYDPAVFRMVLEVTSNTYQNDLRVKVAAYAIAKIPVYVIVDRKHQRLHVLSAPAGGEYANHQVHAPGRMVALPDSIGAKVSLDVTAILTAGKH
ncbi:Uma2 family endonuclease [Streptomyces spectabilis]|nr:Uma2 family endonuclease [Streptomyces spectabilis]MBB5107644.1 Uma2 family endonuclease [Streptomyces spectabilis]MCI3904690.1 Uma2 family endonuclease [Streptomyces spectabilis]GGV03199.1 membrane protein [Streptomyces spectabilis]